MKYFILSFCIAVLGSCSNSDTPDAYGNFESNEILVSALSSGEIISLNIEEGDEMGKYVTTCVVDTMALSLQKQLLYSQKSATSVRFTEINTEIDVLNVSKEQIVREINRFNKLLKDDAATQKQCDDIESQSKLIDAKRMVLKTKRLSVTSQLKIFDRNIDIVNYKIENCITRNPIKGTILEKYVEKNEVAVMGKPIYKLADLSYLDLKAYVSGAQVADVTVGKQVSVRIDKGEDDYYTYKAKVIWIADYAEFTPKTIQTKEERVNLVYAVKIRVKNDGKLKIGMPGEMLLNND